MIYIDIKSCVPNLLYKILKDYYINKLGSKEEQRRYFKELEEYENSLLKGRFYESNNPALEKVRRLFEYNNKTFVDTKSSKVNRGF